MTKVGNHMSNGPNPKGQSTDDTIQDKVIEALRETANRPWTQELAFKQKVSGIMGGLPFDSTVTREQVEEYVRRKEGMVG